MSSTYRPNRLCRYLVAGTYGLVSSLLTPTMQAAHCGATKDTIRMGAYRTQSAPPSLGDSDARFKTDDKHSASSFRTDKGVSDGCRKSEFLFLHHIRANSPANSGEST